MFLSMIEYPKYYLHIAFGHNRLGSITFFNETFQFSERYSANKQAVMKQKKIVMLVLTYFSMIERQKHE